MPKKIADDKVMIKLLFFDAAASGHHGEYLENLLSGMSGEVAEYSAILTHPKLRRRLVGLKGTISSTIRLFFLSEDEVTYLEGAKGIVQIGRRQLEVLGKYLQVCEADHIVLMHMNLHQYALHTWRVSREVAISGILLNPFTPTSRAHGLRAKLFAIITGVRKRLQLRLMLRNKAIEKISLLNDARMAAQLNRWHPSRKVFDIVTDPLPSLWPVAPLAEEDCNGSGRPFRFLLTGSMAPRKGCIETLEALCYLKRELQRPLELRIIGRFRAEAQDYRDLVLAKIRKCFDKGGSVEVQLNDKFVCNEMMSREFAKADCVLAPYLDFYGSSGMIGHACRYQKPLLSCRDGLLGELVRDMQIGLCADPRNPAKFALSMKKILNGDYIYDASAAERYVAQADYRVFAEHLIA